MAFEINSITIVGRLAKDPTSGQTKSGKAWCNFSIANNSGGKDEPASFFDVVVWNKPAENAAKYLSKGNPVGITGSLHQKTWESADGQKHYKVEILAHKIQFLGERKGKGENEGE